MKKYRSFNYKQINSKGDTSHERSKRSSSTKSVPRATVVVLSLVIILFGVKLLLSPIVGAIASMVRESTATLSYLINREGLVKENGVTNILVLGIDERYEGGPALTDTIMILSYNHDTKQASLVSFPRDLWVQVPAFDGVNSYFTKINSLYTVGEEYGYPNDEESGLGGGPGLLARVIENHLAIPIHYYVRVNFDGFRKAIDSVGGIDVYVERAFTDYQYPREGYENAPLNSRWETVSFEQGWQHMDGETALKYSRSRHSLSAEGSDFSRARRQQKVILALKDKVLSNETIFNLDRIRNLYLTLSTEFDSNISVSDLPAMYELVKDQGDLSGVNSIVLNDGDVDDGLLYVPDPSQYGGAFVLLPRGGWSAIEDHVKAILYP